MGEKKVLWPGWETVRLIGRGSFGAVYEIERDVFGHKERAALKVITIPQSESDIDELLNDGYDEESITTRFEGYLHDIVREYSLMADMKGCANIVYCDDVRYIQHDNGMGWDIYIKMELLTALPKALGKSVSDEQVVKIGTDLCSALAFCEKRNLLHRDIKPQNVFVASDGTYKLGDFGIAKTAERTTSGTKTGTYKYMAPEVYNNMPYGGKADIYSLGLVLYWLLNDRRTPFLPMPPQLPSASDEDSARTRRFRGEPTPAPVHGSEALKRIVLKACAYNPDDRYQTADEMLRELNALGVPASASAAQPVADDSRFVETSEEDNATVGAWAAPAAAPQDAGDDATERTVGVWSVHTEAAEKTTQTEERTVGVWDKPEARKPKPAPVPKKPKKKWWLAAVAVVAVAAIAGTLGTLAGSLGTINPPDVALTPALETPTPTTPAPEAPIVAISVGSSHAVGLRADGTVTAVGTNNTGQCLVSNWKDIVAISAGESLTVGLKSDGTVVAVGNNNAGQREVSDWKDIIAVSTRYAHTVGLKSDGTVVAVGYNKYGQCNTASWKDIVAIATGGSRSVGLRSEGSHTVGLKSAGTVVAVGTNNDGQCNVHSWKDIVAVSAGRYHTVGLKSDGTVVATGANDNGQCNVTSWENIVAISAGLDHTVGLKSDGTVVAVGENLYGECDVTDWKDIVAVSAGSSCTIGLKADGTVVVTGNHYNVSNW